MRTISPTAHHKSDALFHRRRERRNCRSKCLPAATIELDAVPNVVSSCLAFETAEGVPVQVLGVDHLAIQYDLGEFILASKPHSVVFESAMSSEFGSTTGNVLTAADAKAGRSDQVALRTIFAVSKYLSSLKNPSEAAQWGEVKEKMYGEQLAAVAALTVGARLVYGDLPKDVTFRRLLHGCSVTDLDRSFGHRSAQNFASMLGQHIPDLEDDQAEKILMTDRECALCHSIDLAARGTAPTGRGVVAIVGEAHLAGIRKLWESGAWRATIDPQPDSGDWRKCVFQNPPETLPSEDQHDLGVRRALAESVVGLRASGAVVRDMVTSLGPIPKAQRENYLITSETYGCCRMLLAPLERDLFDQVVCGRGCDFWEELQPLRDIRPVNGGKGYDLGLLVQLRELNFDLT